MVRFQVGMLLACLVASGWAQEKLSSSSRSSTRAPSSPPQAGSIRDGEYRNSFFGFSYKLPFGWVDRTHETQDDSAESSRSLLLLAIFERPPEASGDTVNSAVVIAAEPVSAYPGLKTAADYFGPLTELATSKGFQPVGDPQQFSVGATHLMRGDFTRTRGRLTLHQTSLVRLAKGYVLSFALIGGSEEETNQRIENLSFTPASK
jgi:hypothetical protein